MGQQAFNMGAYLSCQNDPPVCQIKQEHQFAVPFDPQSHCRNLVGPCCGSAAPSYRAIPSPFPLPDSRDECSTPAPDLEAGGRTVTCQDRLIVRHQVSHFFGPKPFASRLFKIALFFFVRSPAGCHDLVCDTS